MTNKLRWTHYYPYTLDREFWAAYLPDNSNSWTIACNVRREDGCYNWEVVFLHGGGIPVDSLATYSTLYSAKRGCERFLDRIKKAVL